MAAYRKLWSDYGPLVPRSAVLAIATVVGVADQRNRISEEQFRQQRCPSSTVRCLFAWGPAARPIQQKREPAKDKRRNESREFGVNSVRAQRANHEGDQDPCSFSSPSWNQNTDASEDFKHSDDISSVGRVAPMRQPPGPSACRRASQFRDAGPDKYERQ